MIFKKPTEHEQFSLNTLRNAMEKYILLTNNSLTFYVWHVLENPCFYSWVSENLCFYSWVSENPWFYSWVFWLSRVLIVIGKLQNHARFKCFIDWFSVCTHWLHDCWLSIAWEHWPDTNEFNTRSAEFWNRCIRLSCYYSKGHISCQWKTHV